MRRGTLAIAMLAGACGGEVGTTPLAPADAGPMAAGADGGTIDAGAPDAGATPPPDPLYSDDALLEVRIDLPPADWDELRSQPRYVFDDLVGPMCLADPFDSPFTWFHADVTIAGHTFRDAAVSKKGFVGSLSTERPSLKIKLDEFQDGQELFGLSRFTLNNAQQDPAVMRQCLVYGVFRRAGVPAPRCAFARVVVNGAEMGPYVNVEAVKKAFLRRHFADPDGTLYEGSLSDFRSDWMGTFEVQSGRDDPARADLRAVADAVAAGGDPMASLAPLIDLDAYFRFWAVESLVGHWDGYDGNANNFFVYRDPSTLRFRFIPWGADGTLGQEPERPAGAPISVYATAVIPHSLYALPAARARFVREMRAVLAEAWDAPALIADTDRYERLLAPAMSPAARTAFTRALPALRAWIDGRGSAVTRELDAGLGDWPAPLRPAPCLRELGRVEATFVTTWGTHPAPNPFLTGTGTLTGTVGAVRASNLAGGAAAGMGASPGDMGLAVVVVPAVLPDQTVAAVYVSTAPSAMHAGEIALDQVGARGALYLIRGLGQQPELVGWFVSGTIVLDAAATTPGAAVRGRVSARVVSSF